MRHTVPVLAALTGLALAAGCASSPERVGGLAEPVGGIRPTSPAVTSPAAAGSTATSTRRMLGPTGVGKLELGMSRDEADDTQLVDWDEDKQTDDDCSPEYRLTYGGPESVVWLSKDLGIASIAAYPGLATPQGIKLGSSLTQVQAAYPDWRSFTGPQPEGRGHANVPGNSKAVYSITVDDDEVTSLQLELRDQNCYE
jgi:hypothetical protein